VACWVVAGSFFTFVSRVEVWFAFRRLTFASNPIVAVDVVVTGVVLQIIRIAQPLRLVLNLRLRCRAAHWVVRLAITFLSLRDSQLHPKASLPGRNANRNLSHT